MDPLKPSAGKRQAGPDGLTWASPEKATIKEKGYEIIES